MSSSLNFSKVNIVGAGLGGTLMAIYLAQQGIDVTIFERQKFEKNARRYRDYFAQQGRIEARYLPMLLYGFTVGLTLLHAMLLGTLASWVVWSMARRWGRGPAAAAGLATVAWFYLPPAAPYIDTNAFFWSLLALAALWRGLLEPDSPRGLTPFALAGLCAGLAFLSKQNLGGLAIGGLAVLVLWVHRRAAPLLVFAATALAPLGLLTLWAWSQGAGDLLTTYFWQVPLESGRLKYLVPWSGRMVIKALRPEMVDSTFGFMAGKALRELAVYALALVLGWRALRGPRADRALALTAAFLLVFQQWGFNTSNNDEVLYWPFAGLLLACLGHLAREALHCRWRRGVATGAVVLVVLGGFWVGFSRQVHSLKPWNLGLALDHPRLDGLKLYPREGQELTRLLAVLEREVPADERLFVLGHSTLIYAAADRPPPQPLLWFRAGVSYSANDGATDRRIVQALQAHDVRWIVLDPTGADELLGDFPRLAAWVETDFQPTGHDLGDYRLLHRVAASP